MLGVPQASMHSAQRRVQFVTRSPTLAGCELIFQEKASGGRWDRSELQRLMQQLRKGDQVIVWRLDRLYRSVKDLLLMLGKIENTGRISAALPKMLTPLPLLEG